MLKSMSVLGYALYNIRLNSNNYQCITRLIWLKISLLLLYRSLLNIYYRYNLAKKRRNII